MVSTQARALTLFPFSLTGRSGLIFGVSLRNYLFSQFLSVPFDYRSSASALEVRFHRLLPRPSSSRLGVSHVFCFLVGRPFGVTPSLRFGLCAVSRRPLDFVA